jgi:3-hydroxymyristoyl/3-hydroxydecanoyl-(acyl carrier protein) dehydratase
MPEALPETQALAWRVPAGHPAFAGHFPGRPILPGVVLLDRAILLAGRIRSGAAGWQIGTAKFLSPVAPGEQLDFRFQAGPRGGLAFSVHGAGGRTVASGTLNPGTPA